MVFTFWQLSAFSCNFDRGSVLESDGKNIFTFLDSPDHANSELVKHEKIGQELAERRQGATAQLHSYCIFDFFKSDLREGTAH